MNKKTYVILGTAAALMIAAGYAYKSGHVGDKTTSAETVVTESAKENPQNTEDAAKTNNGQTAATESDIPTTIVKSLAKNQRKDGFIDYAFNFYTGEKEDIDNIIRQAEIGIVYVDYLEKHPEDIQIKKALQTLLTALGNKIKPGKYGPQLSFYATEENDTDEEKERKFRGEISATALMTAAMSRYRKLYSELDFATTESYVINTLMSIADFLITSNRLTDIIHQYPPYEVWYALAVYKTAVAKNRRFENTMTKLDRFYVSMESFINDPDSLFYFFKTYDLRKNEVSTYVKGAVLRNVKNFGKMYVNSFNPAELNCQNAALLGEAAEILNGLDKNAKLKAYFIEQKEKLLEHDRKLMITEDMSVSGIGSGHGLKESPAKKFAGFFISGYGNPITTIKNSISCYNAFSE